MQRDISVPIPRVAAIYARENGQGMAFDVVRPTPGGEEPTDAPVATTPTAPSTPPSLTAVPTAAEESQEDKPDDGSEPPEPPKKGGKPTLTRIK